MTTGSAWGRRPRRHDDPTAVRPDGPGRLRPPVPAAPHPGCSSPSCSAPATGAPSPSGTPTPGTGACSPCGTTPQAAADFAGGVTHRALGAARRRAAAPRAPADRRRGRWAGRDPFGDPAPRRVEGPVAALTRARIRTTKARTFWRSVPPVSADLHAARACGSRSASARRPSGCRARSASGRRPRCSPTSPTAARRTSRRSPDGERRLVRRGALRPLRGRRPRRAPSPASATTTSWPQHRRRTMQPEA